MQENSAERITPKCNPSREARPFKNVAEVMVPANDLQVQRTEEIADSIDFMFQDKDMEISQ